MVWYISSSEYRFFIKKLKYQDEIVYDTQREIDDSFYSIVQNTGEKKLDGESIEIIDTVSQESFSFLEALSGRVRKDSPTVLKLPEIWLIENEVLALFQWENLRSIDENINIFWLTNEYPDPYYEWISEDISFYIFPTKTYTEVYDIFDVLSFDIPYTLNIVNTFGNRSFFINMDTNWDDGNVRLVFEYKKQVFWLKMKKNRYNEIREIISTLRE